MIQEPIGRLMGNISRLYLSNLKKYLSHLEIERSFYPLLLIDEGEGKLIQQDLAAILDCDKVQVVRIIDYLSSNGYVEREQNTKDRRRSNLEVTEKAKNYIPDIQLAIKKTTDLALKDLPQNTADELFNILRRIEKNLKANNEIE
jgi:DNA-binding MarR family transcriptional regulator